MKPYPKYKDSGVEWIGQVPEHWDVISLRYLFKIKAGGDLKKEFYSAEQNDLYPYPIYTNSIKSQEAYGFTSKAFFGANSITVTGRGEIGYAVYRDHEFDAIIRLLVMTPNNNAQCKYYTYFINSISKFFGGSTAVNQLSAEQISPCKVFCPPLPEQTAIANYLDRKTAEIDRLIANKERLIELYEEEKTAAINQAVTKGLAPDAPMKPSGIDWLGDIPAHWEMKRLKYVGQIKYGLGQPPREKMDGLPIIRATNVYRGKIDINNLVFVDPEDVPYDRDPILKENDIIVVRSGAYTADSAIIPKEFEGAVAGYDMVLRCFTDYYPSFVSFCLLSNYVLKKQLLLHSLRAAQPHLNREELGETIILIPQGPEQATIVQHIETQCRRLDTIIAKFKKQIELLKEYRTTLISEVVTGKIDVREEVVQ